MDSQTFTLIVIAAVLHALWNVFTKQSAGSKIPLLCLGELVAGLLLLPIALIDLNPEVWQSSWYLPVIGTSLIHALYTACLGWAYQKGDVSLVYPVARGSGIVGTALLATGLDIDHISAIGIYGILTVVTGISLFGFRPKSSPESSGGIAIALVIGLIISCYSVVDKIGVSIVPPLLYISLLSILTPLLLIPFLLYFDQQGLVGVCKGYKKQSFGIGLMSTITYLLILFAFQRSQASYVVALREFSIVIASTLGFGILKESVSLPKLLGIILIVAGTGIIKLA